MKAGKISIYIYIGLICILVLPFLLNIESYLDPQIRASYDMEGVFLNIFITVGPLSILLPALFLVKKYSIAVGGLFLGIGLLILAWVLLNPPRDNYLVYLMLYMCGPHIFFFLLIGGLFLSSGLLRKRAM